MHGARGKLFCAEEQNLALWRRLCHNKRVEVRIYVAGNETSACAVAEKSAAEKAADENYDSGYCGRLRHQSHDVLLSF